MQTAEEDGLPLVTMLMPSFNHAHYVEGSIRSVLDQTYPRVELIVIDDGSTDDTPAIARQLAEKHGFTFLENDRNVGVNETLLRGLALSHGACVGVLASDDEIEPHKIARQVSFMAEHRLDGVYASGVKLYDDGSTEPIDHETIRRKFADGTILDHIYITDTDGPLMQSGLFSRRIFDDVAPFRRDFKSDDHMFLIKALERYKIGFLEERLYRYRIHEHNTYKNYWRTFPYRTEIASTLTPERLRPRYLANIFHSQAEFLFLDGKRAMALKFLLASLVLWPSPARTWRVGVKTVRGILKQMRRRRRSA